MQIGICTAIRFSVSLRTQGTHWIFHILQTVNSLHSGALDKGKNFIASSKHLPEILPESLVHLDHMLFHILYSLSL